MTDHRVELERRLCTVLADDNDAGLDGVGRKGPTAHELATLIIETEEAIANAEKEATLAREQALDPDLTPDPAQAHSDIENTALAAGRLRTLLARLNRRYTEVSAAERISQWRKTAAALSEERDALALEFDEAYPAAAKQLVDLFTRMAALDGKLSRLHETRPSGVMLHLTGPELMARDLTEFSRSVPSLLQAVQLYDFGGRQIWPPKIARDMSIFAPAPYNPVHSAEWFRVRTARAEEAQAESERVNAYYETKARERAKREEEKRAAAE